MHGENMLSINKFLLFIPLIVLISTSANAETLADISVGGKNDPIAGAAKATYKANKETLKQGKAVLLPQLTLPPARLNLNLMKILILLQQLIGQALANQLFVPVWFQFRSAKNMDQAAEAKFSAQQQSLIIRVSESILMFCVLTTISKPDKQKNYYPAQLEQVTERFEVGLLPITDVHEIQAIFDDARVNSLEANGALDIAFDQLQVLSGKSHNQLAGLKDGFNAEAPIPAAAESWVEFALANNFELKASQLTHQAAVETANAAKAQHLPKVTISADYSKRDIEATASAGAMMTEGTAIT